MPDGKLKVILKDKKDWQDFADYPIISTGTKVKKSSLIAGLFVVESPIRKSDTMKKNPENDTQVKQRPSTWKPLATAAAIIAVIQACLTIEGRGIEGFILWVLILFFAYWLFFTFLRWLWRRLRDRA
jgi:hypothetical protein